MLEGRWEVKSQEGIPTELTKLVYGSDSPYAFTLAETNSLSIGMWK